jgi:hypothetical protein
MLEMEEYGVLSDERGGAVQMDIIENGGRQYKSRTTYSESCWGKWMRMSAAGFEARAKKKKMNTGRGGPGWMCPITAFELRFSAPSEPPFARPSRSHATAKRCRIILSAQTPLICPISTVHNCTIHSTMPDTFFFIKLLVSSLIEALET